MSGAPNESRAHRANGESPREDQRQASTRIVSPQPRVIKPLPCVAVSQSRIACALGAGYRGLVDVADLLSQGNRVERRRALKELRRQAATGDVDAREGLAALNDLASASGRRKA